MTSNISALFKLDNRANLHGIAEAFDPTKANMSLFNGTSFFALNDTNITLLFIEKLNEFKENRTMDDTALIILMVSYIILIATGSIGNGLVFVAVIRKSMMRTPRNLFILNLAISDLTLCLITMPFSFIEIVTKFWPFGLITCKLVGGLQGTSIFVSTMSITAIALDRYNVIINPTRDTRKLSLTVMWLISIWTVALLLAIPLFWIRTVVSLQLENILNQTDMPQEKFEVCAEKWPIAKGRFMYSVFTIIIQYFLPTFIVTVSYMRIYKKLKSRMTKKRSAIKLYERRRVEEQRTKRTNMLLISISVIFGISWLPLNIVNIVSDFYFPFQDHSTFSLVFALCHMIGMSSACINPLLYGWLNDNFQKEFKELFSILFNKLCSICRLKVKHLRKTNCNNIETNVIFADIQTDQNELNSKKDTILVTKVT